MSYFILSLDGGGIRGLLTAELVRRLEGERSFLSEVQLFAGTSTGAILALALAKGLEPRAIVDLYWEHGAAIFGSRDLLDAGPADEWVRADYDGKALKAALQGAFGDTTLGDLPSRVLVPTFQLDYQPEKDTRNLGKADKGPRRWKAKFFHNFPRGDGPEPEVVDDADLSLVDLAMRSTAAPTYFPSYQGYVDGGVAANNPSACAVVKALKSGQMLSNLRLLSLGTGHHPKFYPGERHDWGKAQWIQPIVEALFEGGLGMADYQCKQLLGSRYHRLDPKLDERMDLDDVGKMSELVSMAAKTDVSHVATWLAEAGRDAS